VALLATTTQKLSQMMVRSAWLSKFVNLPSGRSHRSIPFWDVMHQCAAAGFVLQRWCSLLQRSDGVIAAAQFCSSTVYVLH